MRWGRQERGRVPEYWGDLLLLMLSMGEKCPAEPAVGALRVNLTHNVVGVNRK
jgi:hypothetical protein